MFHGKNCGIKMVFLMKFRYVLVFDITLREVGSRQGKDILHLRLQANFPTEVTRSKQSKWTWSEWSEKQKITKISSQ